jgi:hypothetical protein
MPGNIWDKPASPHALDDEFESTTMDPSWDYGVGALDFATPIDPYASGVTPSRVKIHTDLRPSWLTMQRGTTISKAYTFPTNFLVWVRFAPYVTTVATLNGDYYCALYLMGTNAGVADQSNAIRLMLRSWTATNSVEYSKSENGGYPLVSNILDTTTRGMSHEYIGIHKIGATYHAWAMTSGGIRTYMGSTTWNGAGTLDRVAVVMGGNETVPGSPIHAIDFMRVVESATYLP